MQEYLLLAPNYILCRTISLLGAVARQHQEVTGPGQELVRNTTLCTALLFVGLCISCTDTLVASVSYYKQIPQTLKLLL